MEKFFEGKLNEVENNLDNCDVDLVDFL